MKDNLLQNLPDPVPDELFETLVKNGTVRIERIVSDGHSSPPGFWYNQADHELVVLIQGRAVIEFEDGDATVEMQTGSWLEIPAHKKHRVASTADDTKTVWLAVFWS